MCLTWPGSSTTQEQGPGNLAWIPAPTYFSFSKCLSRLDVSFLCICPLIDYETRHNIVKKMWIHEALRRTKLKRRSGGKFFPRNLSFYVSVVLSIMKISQSESEKLISYCKKFTGISWQKPSFSESNFDHCTPITISNQLVHLSGSERGPMGVPICWMGNLFWCHFSSFAALWSTSTYNRGQKYVAHGDNIAWGRAESASMIQWEVPITFDQDCSFEVCKA